MNLNPPPDRRPLADPNRDAQTCLGGPGLRVAPFVDDSARRRRDVDDAAPATTVPSVTVGGRPGQQPDTYDARRAAAGRWLRAVTDRFAADPTITADPRVAIYARALELAAEAVAGLHQLDEVDR